MKSRTLYKKTAKGDLQQWTIWTTGATIHTEYGKVDGKLQRSAGKDAKPKNVGRSNETSAKRQALLEAKSLWRKQQKKGYQKTQHAALTEEIYLPMTAQTFSSRPASKITWPLDLQPKLNGIRCMARRVDLDTIEFTSRGGEKYTLPHLVDEIRAFLPCGTVLDGELYIHGMPLRKINSLVKRNRKKSAQLEFRAFDVFQQGCDRHGVPLSGEPWLNRIRDLHKLLAVTDRDMVQLVPTITCNNEAELMEAVDRFVADGYEGGIVRLWEGVYRLGYRSMDLLKIKPFIDDEFPVVDFTNGDGKFEDCVIWICKVPNGNLFRCVPKGTMKERRRWYKRGRKYIGKYLTVRFQNLTDKEEVPYLPVGEVFRLDEDMPVRRKRSRRVRKVKRPSPDSFFAKWQRIIKEGRK